MSDGIFKADSVARVAARHGAGARGFSQVSRIPRPQLRDLFLLSAALGAALVGVL
jgi:hypothetical protein